jgi:hypothetical protein
LPARRFMDASFRGLSVSIRHGEAHDIGNKWQ